MHYDLEFVDHESSHFECAPNPLDAKVLPSVSGIIRDPCDQYGHNEKMAERTGLEPATPGVTVE
jgi:hypothetical protein